MEAAAAADTTPFSCYLCMCAILAICSADDSSLSDDDDLTESTDDSAALLAAQALGDKSLRSPR